MGGKPLHWTELNLDHEGKGTEINGLGTGRGNTKEEEGDGKINYSVQERPKSKSFITKNFFIVFPRERWAEMVLFVLLSAQGPLPFTISPCQICPVLGHRESKLCSILRPSYP